MCTELFSSLGLEQVEHIWPGCVLGHLVNDLILVLADQLRLELTEHLEQFQVDRLFYSSQRELLRRVIDRSDELSDVESQEFGVILKDLVEE